MWLTHEGIPNQPTLSQFSLRIFSKNVTKTIGSLMVSEDIGKDHLSRYLPTSKLGVVLVSLLLNFEYNLHLVLVFL